MFQMAFKEPSTASMSIGYCCPIYMKEISAEKFYVCQKYNGDIPIRKPISLCIPELF